MKHICLDLQAEHAELAALADGLTPAQWTAPTSFYGWTAYDEIAHLCLFDDLAVLAATDAAAFVAQRTGLEAQLSQGRQISEIARERFAHLRGVQLLDFWRTRYSKLVGLLEVLNPKARLPWFGPDMSARSFATARLMETWAHGQDVYDVLRRPREPNARLRHIAHLGVATFQWTFANRGLPLPVVAPYVELLGPDDDLWCWGAPSQTEFVRGTAQDFCLVVTQRRHYTDTTLAVGGKIAVDWLQLAQCFAGPAADGPAPGVRNVVY
jgi:uncharacterized protein (TIGR03084 family)